MTATKADEEWWAEYYRQEAEEQEAFRVKHSDLKPGQVVHAFLGRYKKLKTQVIIIQTPVCDDSFSTWNQPIYWVQRLQGNPHKESVKREDIVW